MTGVQSAAVELTLGELLDDAVVARLAGSTYGGDDVVGRRTSALVHECVRALKDAGASLGERAYGYAVPGRIEVLGKHTDYAGGRSLLAATERGFVAVGVRRRDERVRIVDGSSRTVVELTMHGGAGAPPWSIYPGTVLRRLDRNFPGARGGADISFASNLPAAAGLSSSSAFVTAVFLVLRELRRIGRTDAYRESIGSREDLADYLGAVENGLDFRALPGEAGVGTRGGSEDHTALLCARPGQLVQYSFAPVRFEDAVALPQGHGFVVGCSGVQAEKAGAARERYNALAEQSALLAELWRAATAGAEPTLGAVLRSGPGAEARLRAIVQAAAAAHLREALLARLAQFAEESESIIPAATAALRRGALDEFGVLVDRSQALAESALGNQIPETVWLVRSARRQGAVAASAFGAGFGGSAWALVRDSDAEAFADDWRRAYLDRFAVHERHCTFFTTHAAPAASRLGASDPAAHGA